MKTLIIILSETRASEFTFDSFKANVLEAVGGEVDVGVCIGVKPDYDYENPFYKIAKHRFIINEPDDYATVFDDAYAEIINNQNNQNGDGKCQNQDQAQPPLPWRDFLKIREQFMGGVKNSGHDGSAGILIYYRWMLLKHLKETALIDQYDRFIITRSDFVWVLPHPSVVEVLTADHVWIPDEEWYGGYTDRHAVLTRDTVEPYLNIFNNMVLRSHTYYTKMKAYNNWNLERLIRFHLVENGINHLVKAFPYVMYSVRGNNGTTRWSVGIYNDALGYNIKYKSEYDRPFYYKAKWDDFERAEASKDTKDTEHDEINKTRITLYYKSLLK